MSTAIVTQLTNNFTFGGELLLKSLFYYNDVDLDIVVLVDDKFTQHDRINAISHKVKFHTVDKAFYEPCMKHFKGTREWTINPAHRFDIFTLPYDRIVYMDSDILIVDSIAELFECSHDFAAAPYTSRICIGSLQRTFTNFETHLFNAGVMCISKKYLTTDMRDELIDICMSGEWSGNQSILNAYFKQSAKLLSGEYNTTTEGITEHRFKHAKVYHFVGHKKVWDEGTMFDKFDQSIRWSAGIQLLVKLMRVYNHHCKLLFK